MNTLIKLAIFLAVIMFPRASLAQTRDVTLTPDQLPGLTITLSSAGAFQLSVVATGPGGTTAPTSLSILVVDPTPPVPAPTLTVQDAAGEVGTPISLDITVIDATTLTITIPDGATLSVEEVAPPVVVDPPPPPVTPINHEVIYLPDSGVINVKTQYGAKGDGFTDDTAAIQLAIHENMGTVHQRRRIIYFPVGTYLVSDRLEWKDSSGTWHAYVGFLGQSRSETIIRLKDNAPGYGDPDNPRAIIFTASEREGDGIAGGKDWFTKGEGLAGFSNNIQNLTVDIGSNNPGAIGIDFLGHNQATVENVLITSGDGICNIGLALTRKWLGPALIKNVEVNGCDYGIKVEQDFTTVTFEHITVKNQHIAGFYNYRHIVSIRGLTSINSVPAIQNDHPYSLMVLIDATLTGGSLGISAITNSDDAKLYARNIISSGYKSAVENHGSVVSGDTITEFVSHPIRSVFPSPQRSLNLPVQETPEYHNANPEDWVSVTHFGAIPDDAVDDTAAFQNAIDSGKPVVYLPFGKYILSDTVHVRGTVRKIIGFGGSVMPLALDSFTNGKPAFLIEDTIADAVIIERVAFGSNGWVTGFPAFSHPSIKHASSKTLVLKNLMSRVSYSNVPGSGPVFIEDVCCGLFEFNEQDVWARQLNPEGKRHVLNNGSDLWILGLKTEGITTIDIIYTKNGGQTELLGGLFYIGHIEGSLSPDIIAFTNEDSSHSLIYSAMSSGGFAVPIREIRDGQTILVTRDVLYSRRVGEMVPLYVGYKAEIRPGTVVVVQPGNSLWRLARRAYGAGMQYMMIFEANRDQIRDPDLIYPGQVFALPVTN